ncbi:MAG: hypothetical protein AAFY10_04805 [Pseudomonadota bacterium]
MKHVLISLLAGTTVAACQTTLQAPIIDAPERISWEGSPRIIVRGLAPGETYELEAERVGVWDNQTTERSELIYLADNRGRIDTSKLAPKDMDEADAYLPIRTMGLVRETLADLEPGQLRLTVSDKTDAVIVERVVGIGPDLNAIETEMLSPSFPGAFVMKPAGAEEKLPVLVLLGGSEGGDGSARASGPLFAEQGFAVLGLPYYSPAWFGQQAQIPELPRGFTELPIDYLEGAVSEVRKRSDIKADKLLLMGGSKGAEYVLLAASLIPDSSTGGGFCGIVADVPSDVVWEGWGPGTAEGGTSGFSWRGEALPFVPYVDMGRAWTAKTHTR